MPSDFACYSRIYIWESLFDEVSPSDANLSVLFGEEWNSRHRPTGGGERGQFVRTCVVPADPHVQKKPQVRVAVSLDLLHSSWYDGIMERACVLFQESCFRKMQLMKFPGRRGDTVYLRADITCQK